MTTQPGQPHPTRQQQLAAQQLEALYPPHVWVQMNDVQRAQAWAQVVAAVNAGQRTKNVIVGFVGVVILLVVIGLCISVLQQF